MRSPQSKCPGNFSHSSRALRAAYSCSGRSIVPKQVTLLHSHSNWATSPSPLPTSRRISTIRSFSSRISCAFRDPWLFTLVPFLPRFLRGIGAVLLPQSSEFHPRALDNPLEVGQKIGVHRVVARLEGFYRLLAAGDQDRQQRCLLFVRSGLDVRSLPRYTAAKTTLVLG